MILYLMNFVLLKINITSTYIEQMWITFLYALTTHAMQWKLSTNSFCQYVSGLHLAFLSSTFSLEKGYTLCAKHNQIFNTFVKKNPNVCKYYVPEMMPKCFIHSYFLFIRSVIHCNVRFIEGIVTVQQIFSIISENYVIL